MFDYARPKSLNETFALLREMPDARLLSGGTDLLVNLRGGRAATPLVIDLKRVADLEAGITQREGWLRVGAGTVMTDLAADDHVRDRFPSLVGAALVVGSVQIRNRATLAGNVCNASPAADTAPPLLIHDAVVELAGSAGLRRVELSQFFLGPGRTALQPGELVAAIELPIPGGPLGTAFARMTRRRGVDLATVSLCCSVSATGVTRFAFGAVGPRPFGVTDDTGILADPAGDPALQDEALRRLTGHASPLSNVRASREYREAMLLVLGRRALEAARQRLREAHLAGT
ncbi:MAG: xanthine dehydrogenase family protein subunit M [Chloroflexota bacterium]